MYIEPHRARLAGNNLSSFQRRMSGSVFVGLAAQLLALTGERRRARQATEELAVLKDRMLADIDLRREDVPFAALGDLDQGRVRTDGLAQLRRYLAALAVIAAAVASLTLAAPPAFADGAGNGDPFALHVAGGAFSVGRPQEAQVGMDAGAQTFPPFPATRQVQAALPQQVVGGRFALQTRP